MLVLRRDPGINLLAIALLAIGIGSNTAIFSVINAVLLRPLPYPDADRLVSVFRTARGLRGPASVPKFVFWRDRAQSLNSLCAYDFAGAGWNLAGKDGPELVQAIRVSAAYFETFGAGFTIGRAFLPSDDRPGGPRVAVLSAGLWQRRFASDSGIVGRSIALGDDLYSVVGVTSPDFFPDPRADLWLPLQADGAANNKGHFLLVAGKLRPGVTLLAANAQLSSIAAQFRAAHPDQMEKTESAAAVDMREAVVGDVRRPLTILAGAVGLLLVMACANIASLKLTRAARRRKEFAIRSAIGAGRAALIRHLLVESMPIAAAGGLLGLLLGTWGVRVLLAISPPEFPRAHQLAHTSAFADVLDWRVFTFAIAASAVTTVIFSLIPALWVSQTDILSTLLGRESTGAARPDRAQTFLVVAEVAIAMVLLCGALLLIRTFSALNRADPGFQTRNILTIQMTFAGERYSTTASMLRYEEQATAEIERLPGVVAAAPMVILPAQGEVDLPFVIDGRQLARGENFTGDEYWRFVGPHFFQVFEIRLRRGRLFDDRDRQTTPPVAVVSEAMAKKYWPGGDALGKRITVAKGMGELQDVSREIIGVVNDTREGGVERPARPVIYVPSAQLPDGVTRFAQNVLPTSWAIRTTVEPKSLAEPIRRRFLAADDRIAPANIRTMQEVRSTNNARQRFNAVLLQIFAGIGLVLAGAGIYGLISYAVAQRTGEIGIRMALGAQGWEVVRLVAGYGFKMAASGVVLGLGAAYACTRFLASMLFGVTPTDLPTFLIVAIVPMVLAFIATLVPTLKATRVDVVQTLRADRA